jgi:hypothetical protein
MAVYNLSAGTLPANTGYPANIQGLLDLLESYMTVLSDDSLNTIVISNATPKSSDNTKVWFQTSSDISGEPQAVKIYSQGKWQEFTPFAFGDIVLTDVNSTISSPWGIGNSTYVVDGITKLTPTTPAAPAGTQYKVYVGYYE